MGLAFLNSIIFWIVACLSFVALFGIQMIFIMFLAKKTHAMVEFKSWLKGVPISLFFQENRYCEWKPIKPEAGIIYDKNYGSFVINEKGTYIDKRTHAVLIPFSADYAGGINVKAAKLADDLQYIIKDEEKMKELRYAVANNLIDDSTTIQALKTSIHFGAIKNMVNAIIPHNVTAKIEKMVASRMKGYGTINTQQIILTFVAIFGAILMGYLVLKMVGGV